MVAVVRPTMLAVVSAGHLVGGERLGLGGAERRHLGGAERRSGQW